MVGAPAASSSLKEYLKRYQDGNEEENKKKKKKKKVKSTTSAGVLVVDEDPMWQKPVTIEEEDDNDSADEEKPQVDEDIEVKRMKRLEFLRSRRPFGAISEDGSGWVSISDTPKVSPSTDQIANSSPMQRKRSNTPPQNDPRPTSEPDLDLSPPRKQQAWNSTPSPEHDLKPASDLSPPRKRRARNDTPSPENDLKPVNEPDFDLSPPRKRRARNDTPSPGPELKPSRKADAELLRSRKHTARNDSPSPEREKRSSRAAAEDLSPPRQREKHYQSSLRGSAHHSSPSPEPQKEFSNPLSDLSPPRRVRQDDSHASSRTDLSPPRKGRKNRSASSDLSARSASQFLDDSDVALGSSGLDLSPPRKKKQKESSAPNQRPKTGLVTGQDIKQEIAKAKKEDLQRFKQMDPLISGRGAEPVYRDKVTGERLTKDQYLKLQKKEEKPKEVKLEWGKGLAQKRETEARLKELESERDKPFARSRDDPELDKMLKERVRFGDPMAHLVKKKQLEPLLEDLGDNEKMKESGFVIPQEIPSHSWIRRGIHPPTNRYGIKPGRHWDGVDRSNGFEKQMFKRMNEKQATEREAYLWSVADM